MITALLAAALMQATPAPVDCSDTDHQAFAFWVGDWDVSPTGTETVVARSAQELARNELARANEMYSQIFVQFDQGKGSALAVVLFILVTPILVYNIQSLRKERAH